MAIATHKANYPWATHICDELAAAMSFPVDYFFAGNRRDKVRQIGGAVPAKLAESLITTLL